MRHGNGGTRLRAAGGERERLCLVEVRDSGRGGLDEADLIGPNLRLVQNAAYEPLVVKRHRA